MNVSLSERRLADNEVVFRQYNERVTNGLEEIKNIAKEDGQEGLISQNDAPLLFYCECSDENCRKRVKIKPSRYHEIHKRRDHFVIVCGHEIKKIEHVIGKETDFCVIEKFILPSESAPGLHKTDADNS